MMSLSSETLTGVTSLRVSSTGLASRKASGMFSIKGKSTSPRNKLIRVSVGRLLISVARGLGRVTTEFTRPIWLCKACISWTKPPYSTHGLMRLLVGSSDKIGNGSGWSICAWIHAISCRDFLDKVSWNSLIVGHEKAHGVDQPLHLDDC